MSKTLLPRSFSPLTLLLGMMCLASPGTAQIANWCTGNKTKEAESCHSGSPGCTVEYDDELDAYCDGAIYSAPGVNQLELEEGNPDDNAKYQTETTTCCSIYECKLINATTDPECIQGAETGTKTFLQGYTDTASCTERPLIPQTDPETPPGAPES